MKKAVIYWSGTGNTAAMASAIAAGMGEGTELYSSSQAILQNMTKSLSAAPQWVTKFWKKANLIPSSPLSKASWAAKRLLCLVPTAGETASG